MAPLAIWILVADNHDHRHKRTHESHQNQSQAPSAPVTATNSPKYALTIPDEEHDGNEWASAVEGDNHSENGRVIMQSSNPASTTSTANDTVNSSAKTYNIFTVSASSSPVIHSGQVNGTGMMTSHGITPQLLRQRIWTALLTDPSIREHPNFLEVVSGIL